MTRIPLETDCSCLVPALTSNAYDHAVGGVFFKEIKELMLHFDIVEIMFTPRLCNSVAHELARLGVRGDFDQFVVWTDPLPEFVMVLVDRDVADPDVNE